jgi:hypothetical protein
MACVIVPGAEAVAVYAIVKVLKSRSAGGSGNGPDWIRKLEWLYRMLWGGVFLLLIEHIWHGEITFSPPFLTAMQSPMETAVMLHEMATAGVAMAVLVTVAWFLGTVVADRLRARERAAAAQC